MIETTPGEWGWVLTDLRCAWETKRKNTNSFKVARYACCSPTARTTPPFGGGGLCFGPAGLASSSSHNLFPALPLKVV